MQCRDIYILDLIVFQLLVRCVYTIQLYIHGHVRCDILRTLSTIAQSVIVSSSSDCISACIIAAKSIVDGLIDKHRELVFPKMKAQSPA